nr:helix-turn-helix domain-containing protein [Pseudoclavibacter alba]
MRRNSKGGIVVESNGAASRLSEPPARAARGAVTRAEHDPAADESLDLNRFRNVVNESFVPLEITADDPASFRARVSHVNVHGVSFTDIRAGAHTVLRTPELIAESSEHCVKISRQMEGRGIHRQHGRSVDLQPGDLVVYDTSQPYELSFTDDFRVLVMMVPHERLKVPPHAMNDITAVRLDGSSGLGRVVSPFLATLGTSLDELRGPAGVYLVQSAVQLVDTLLANSFDLNRVAADPHRALLESIRDDIDQRLGDTTLSPSTIAERAYISVRHLHALFHDRGETVAGYIRKRRLECAYLDLVNPEYAHRSVSAIGADWGLANAAHFSRLFKVRYGESPSEVRRRAFARN